MSERSDDMYFGWVTYKISYRRPDFGGEWSSTDSGSHFLFYVAQQLPLNSKGLRVSL